MSDLAFDRNMDARYGEEIVVAPGVRRVLAPNAGAFTFLGTNSYLIGDDPVALVDPGPADGAHLSALLAAIGGAEVAAILVTHGHLDHVGAVAPLAAATGAPVLGAPHHGASSVAGTLLDAAMDHAYRPGRLLGDGERIPIGDLLVEVVATPGHSSDHLAFAMPSLGLIFSGDHVMGWSTTVVAPPGGEMTPYLASLDRIAARPERLFLPGHGPAIADGPAHARALRRHREAREAAILARLAAGDRTAEAIVAAVYLGLDPALQGAAALSVTAHLERLVELGRAEEETAGGPVRRFRPG